MKKNKFDLHELDDNIVENIAESYPDLTEDEKNKICRKTRKRLDSFADFKGDTVSGVEPAKKRGWYLWGSVAAAVFAVAVIPIALNGLKNSPNMQNPQTIEDLDIDDNSATPVITDYITSDEGKESFASTPDAPAEPDTEQNSDNITPESSTETDKETSPAPPENPEDNKDVSETSAVPTTEPVIIPPQPTEPPVTTWVICSTPLKETAKVTKPVVTTPVELPTSQGTPTYSPVINDATKAIKNCLANLNYQPYTCDGLPEFLYETGGTTYQINFTSKWIWRNGTEEAVMTDEVYKILNENKSYLGQYIW